MEYGNFLGVIMTYKKASDEISELYEIGFDFLEGKYKLSDRFYEIMKYAFSSHYNEEGMDWISWFIHENDYGNKVWDGPLYQETVEGKIELLEREEGDYFGAKDADGNPIFYSFESAWEYLEANCKLANED
jgi:hypothetical protein